MSKNNKTPKDAVEDFRTTVGAFYAPRYLLRAVLDLSRKKNFFSSQPHL